MIDRSLLSPKQVRSVAEATQRINIWHGAVRSGKTIASLLAWLIFIADAPAGQLLIVGKTRDTIERNVIGPLQDPALFGPLARHIIHTKGSNDCWILGRHVHLIGANDSRSEEKLRGLTAAGAYVDEATLVPEQFWNQLLARLSVPGARLFATTNPDNPQHWLRRNFILKQLAHLAAWHFELDDNPSLTDGYVAALKAEFVGLWYRRFILGQWVQAQGAIYDCWDETLMVVGAPSDVDPLPAGVTPMRWWAACDYGTANPFDAILFATGSDGRVYAVDEWRWDSHAKRRQLTDVDYSAELRSWIDSRSGWGALPEWWFIDPSAASFKVQLRSDRVDGVRDAHNEVADGIRTVAAALASGRFRVHARCGPLIEEIPGYVWDPKAAEKGEDAPLKVADHACDAARYGLASAGWMWKDEPLRDAA